MSAGPQGTSQQASQTTWTEPPWSGWIETTGDALLILEAARRGLIPRVTRRLVDSERKMITSGSVFVFDEDESGIKRWTDGFYWSPSRILGNFLLYRETDKRGNRSSRADPDSDAPDTTRPDGSLSRPKNDSMNMGIDKHRERTLLGSLTNTYKFKPDGLMKKTFSLTINGVAQHLISYYRVEDVENGRLRSPSSLPELATLVISPEYLDKTHFRNPPKVENVEGILRYRGEADDIDPPLSPSSMAPNPLASNHPLLTDGHVAEPASSAKRPKRFLPYKHKKKTKSTADASSDSTSSSSDTSGTVVGTSEAPMASPTPSMFPPDPNACVPSIPPHSQYPYFHPPPPLAPLGPLGYQQPAHMYPQNPYPPVPPPQPINPIPSGSQQAGQYPYPYSPPPAGPQGHHPGIMQPPHPGADPHQPFYSYYPPLPPGYPPYPPPGSGWAPYPPTGYPPIHHQPPTIAHVPREHAPNENGGRAASTSAETATTAPAGGAP